jgi:hypothetical protein
MAGKKGYNKRLIEFGNTNFRSNFLIFKLIFWIESNMEWSQSRFGQS